MIETNKTSTDVQTFFLELQFGLANKRLGKRTWERADHLHCGGL